MPRHSGKNNRQVDSAFQGERDAIAFQKANCRTRRGRAEQEAEEAYWLEEQVRKLQEAFPHVDEVIIREQFLACGQKFETTVDCLLQLGSNPAPRPLFMRQQAPAKKMEPKFQSAPAAAEFPTLEKVGKMSEWEVVQTEEIILDDDMISQATSLSWCDLAKKNGSVFVNENNRKFVGSPARAKKFMALFEKEEDKKEQSDDEYSTSFQLRKSRGRKNRESCGYATNPADVFCEDE